MNIPKKSEGIKDIAVEREEQSQAQETILKQISKIPGPQRSELTSLYKPMTSRDNC